MAELSKLINGSKNSDIRTYNIARIEETLTRGRSLTKKKLAIGRDRMCALVTYW